jgi:hypothetical protein
MKSGVSQDTEWKIATHPAENVEVMALKFLLSVAMLGVAHA